MKILVIGGSGFIGSRIIRRLIGGGDEAICFDLIPRPELWQEAAGKVMMVKGDVNAVEEVIETIQEHRVDAIINLAYILGRPTETRPATTIKLNILGMNNVFEAAPLTGVKRVLFASSIAVYGPQDQFGDRPVTEEDNPVPVWIYGGHKLFNEFMAQKYRELYGMEVVAVRIAATYGFGRETSWGGWNSLLISEPSAGRPITVPLPSSQRWPLVYVEDTADLFVRICRAESVKHTVYGTGGQTVSMAEVVAEVRALLPEAVITFDETAALLPNLYRVNSDRAEQEFGFKRRPLKEGIRETMVEALAKAGRPPLIR